MKGLVERIQGSRGRERVLLLSLLVLATALGLVAFWSTAPRYLLWINGEKVAEAREPGALRGALSGWATEALVRPVTLEHEGRSWSYSRAELGQVFPLGEGYRDLERLTSSRAWWQRSVKVELELVAGWDLVRLEAALAPIRESVERPPVSALLSAQGELVTVVPSVDGLSVDGEGLRKALLAGGHAEPLPLPVAAVPPQLTTRAVEGLGIKRLIAQWSTHYDPSIPRADNVERAALAFDGLILKPGELLSYNATVGPIDASTGWKEAYVIVAGQLVPGIGGGVCQVATTLYGAALRANMEVLERHPHQLAVSYIPPSEDAAVAQGYQDLKIRNTTPGHLLVRTEAGGGTVTIRLYGDLPEGQEVKIESRVTGAEPYSTRVVEDPSLPAGQQLMVSAGARGLRSEAYRLLFRNGELIKRELLSRDRYLPTTAIVRSGPAPEAPPSASGQSETAQPPAAPSGTSNPGTGNR